MLQKFDYVEIGRINNSLIIRVRQTNKFSNYCDAMLENVSIDIPDSFQNLLSIKGTQFFTYVSIKEVVKSEFIEKLEVTDTDYYSKKRLFSKKNKIILKSGIYVFKNRKPFELITNGAFELYE